VRVTDSNRTLVSDVDDHVALVGLLDGGALLTMYFRGGSSRAGDVRWELNGTLGDILVTTPSPAHPHATLNVADLTVAVGTGSEQTVTTVDVPSRNGFDLPEHPAARNVALMWGAILRDIREDTHLLPDFGHASMLQGIVASAEASSRTLLNVTELHMASGYSASGYSVDGH
jgi:predicted dehydrogenase